MAETAMFVTHHTQPIVDERLTSNAGESDTRIWLHVLHSAGTRKLVLSPDTDVYHITIIAETQLDFVVRLSPFRTKITGLTSSSFKNDPDLAAVEESKIV